MPIDTNFTFVHHHQGQQNIEMAGLVNPVDRLGLLRDLVGNSSARTWKGTGFNVIWRPSFQPITQTAHFLQLNLTNEELSFNDITGPNGIANRGLLQEDIFLGGLAYLQTINDSFDGEGQHFEPGVFINVPSTTNPAEPQTVARMGSIPHGTTINLQGRAFQVGQPQFKSASITPFVIGSADDGATGLIPFPEEDLAIASTTRTDLQRLPGLTQAHLTNPNLFLIEALNGQNITRTTVIELQSNSSPITVPDVGGGVANIAFLVGKGSPPNGGPNADAPTVSATFWIEEGTDAAGQPLLQLQYTQRILLNFNGLSWPHVTVATLVPA